MDDKLVILLEEWKQNVALYIDQDKRGMERTKLFLTVHGGLLVFFGVVWKNQADPWTFLAGIITAAMGIFFTVISQLMARRAHAFILLRKAQAMLIEDKIKDIVAPGSPWETSLGVLTTFTREHVSFRRWNNINEKWRSLIEEVKRMDQYSCRPLTLDDEWKSSMGHLRWLTLVHYALFSLWIVLGSLISISYLLRY